MKRLIIRNRWRMAVSVLLAAIFMSAVVFLYVLCAGNGRRPGTAVYSATPSSAPAMSAAPAPSVPADTPVPTPAASTPVKSVSGLVRIKDIDASIIIELKYSTADNFTHKVIYPFKTCLLLKNTALKLKAANAVLKEQGYRIKVFDGYRPLWAQKILWEAVSDPDYVADPYKGGSMHNRGCAVDVTLIGAGGEEVRMPSEYDDLSAAGGRNNPDMTEEARRNLKILTDAMTKNGFRSVTTEWWHYSDTDSADYGILDVDPGLFE